MSEEEIPVSIPLDSERFLRRECPYCCREFKIQMSEADLSDLVQRGIDSFMLEQQGEATRDTDSGRSASDQMFTCPYCGEEATVDSWWTQEQLSYLRVIVQNVMARMLNEHLIRPMRRSFGRSSGGAISISFEGRDMPTAEEWISPEVDDMTVHDLPCCSDKLKLSETWTGEFRCYYCGFPYRPEEQ